MMGEQMNVQRMSRRDALRSGVVGLLIGVPLVLSGGSSVAWAAKPEDITGYTLGPVSYTHLTLPTSDLV